MAVVGESLDGSAPRDEGEEGVQGDSHQRGGEGEGGIPEPFVGQAYTLRVVGAAIVYTFASAGTT